MTTNLITNGSSTFRIRRPVITSSGFSSDVDPTVKSHLDELNEILGRRIFHREMVVEYFTDKSPDKTTDGTDGGVEDLMPGQEVKKSKSGRRFIERPRITPNVQDLLRLPLTPKRSPDEGWSHDSLVYQFKHTAESPDNLTLSDLIDTIPALSNLKYAFQSNLDARRNNLDFNSKSVLDTEYPAISDYLVAYAYYLMDLQEVNGLKNFILSHKAGVHNVANYAAVSAARTIVNRDQLKVPGYNEDDSVVVKRLQNAGLSLSVTSFEDAVKAIFKDFVFNSDEEALIDKADIGKIPTSMRPLLVRYIQNSPIKITPDNVNYFLPQFILQIQGSTRLEDTTEGDRVESDKDFSVEFFEDDTAMVQVSKSAVLCAAQLYYDMIVGDELDVFNTVNFFTHRYLLRGNIEIQDSRLREDLQQYVFSNRFTDLKSLKLVDRTRPGERQMFYRQVFNYGNGPVTEDVIVNTEYSRLWKVLILESAKYIERAQAAFNPDSYVSRQNVMQAVEDLQYNLSTHCTGMANVITPLIYAELDFVIKRIFMHPEVIRQIVPTGGTWWRVVEVLYAAMRNARPKATVLYNKAKLGHAIIRSIADYNPASFEDDQTFSDFISNVDAFITTQSILQETLTDQIKKDDEDQDNEQNEAAAPVPAAVNGSSPKVQTGAGDEWDF